MSNPPSESSQSSRPSRTSNRPARVPTTVTSQSMPASSVGPGFPVPIESLERLSVADDDSDEGEGSDYQDVPEFGSRSKQPRQIRPKVQRSVDDTDPTTDRKPRKQPAKVTKTRTKDWEKALASAKRLVELIESMEDPSEEDDIASEFVRKFVKERFTRKLVFSEMTVQHLDDLKLSEGQIRFNPDALSKRARKRQLSERFKQTEALVDKMVLTNKEVRSVFKSYDYVLESMDNPGPRGGNEGPSLEPKFAPELPFEPVLHDGKDGKYLISGIADMVFFMVDPLTGLDDHDVKSLGALHRQLTVPGSSVGSMEIKSPTQFCSDKHKGEGVAQAKNASEALGNLLQKFILTDGERWKFCVYDQEAGVYHLSNTLGPSRHDRSTVLAALDAWVRFEPRYE